MLNEQASEKIEAATVRVGSDQYEGLGVLVPGGLILSSASFANVMPTMDGDQTPWSREQLQPVLCEPRDGESFRAQIVALDTLAGLMVLDRCDREEYEDCADLYEAFANGTEPVPVRTEPLPLLEMFEAFVLGRNGEWLSCSAEERGEDVWIGTAETVPPGSLGGAVVDSEGAVIGIIKAFGQFGKPQGIAGWYGMGVGVPGCLPVWVAKQMGVLPRQRLLGAASQGE